MGARIGARLPPVENLVTRAKGTHQCNHHTWSPAVGGGGGARIGARLPPPPVENLVTRAKGTHQCNHHTWGRPQGGAQE